MARLVWVLDLSTDRDRGVVVFLAGLIAGVLIAAGVIGLAMVAIR